jgi:hypothetical protein
MKTTECDICGNNDKILDVQFLRVEVLDGIHPHNNSEMRKIIDVCISCAKRMGLKCNVELSELINKMKDEIRSNR